MKTLLLVALIGLTASLAGCATQKGWVYTPNNYPAPTVMLDKTIVVPPFEDARPNENDNRLLMYMVPLVPYGWGTFNVPETSQMHVSSGIWINYKPTEDFAKALVEDLKRTGYFREAYFDYRTKDGDYMIRGKILNTEYRGKIFSYCLSIYGPVLWFIGLPAGTVANELSVELAYVDLKTNKVLFSKTYDATPYFRTSWIYVMKNDFNYSTMLQEVYAQFCRDLQPHLKPAAKQSE